MFALLFSFLFVCSGTDSWLYYPLFGDFAETAGAKIIQLIRLKPHASFEIL